MNEARLAFESVTCLRGDRLLFEGLSFALMAGEAAVVSGPNGVGKSSLLRIAAGLLRPAAGTIQHNACMALADEGAALDARRPLGQALAFWTQLDGGGADAVQAGLLAMGIETLSEVPVRMLSTGQRKRATLARTIASGAAIWLLDEPGNGLDCAALDRLGGAMAAHRAGGGIVLAATHQPLDLPDAREIALA